MRITLHVKYRKYLRKSQKYVFVLIIARFNFLIFKKAWSHNEVQNQRDIQAGRRYKDYVTFNNLQEFGE